MQNDIVLYNVPEVQGKVDSVIATDIMTNKLQISHDCLYSQTNPAGTIQIDNAYRIGKKLGEKPRPLVISFSTQRSKKLVMEQYRKVQKLTSIRITDHFPSEMRERRSIQKDSLKKYKELYKDSDTQVKLIKDKLIVGTKVVEDAFQKNPLITTPCNLPKPQSDLKHTELKEINGSTFQGHAIQVHSIAEAASAKDSLFQIPQ